LPIASLACAIWALSLPAAAFDLQGHRGARGLAPENTLAGFRTALDLGVTTLETDLAVTKDEVVVISHDPLLNPDLPRLDGQWIATAGPVIRTLTLADLKRYDIGRLNPASKYAQQYPEQKPVDGERFPTIEEFFAMAGPDVRFNIEIKTNPNKPELTLDPERFAELAVAAIRKGKAGARSTIQSFDWRTLKVVEREAREIATSYLTESGDSDPQRVHAAGGRTWSPDFRALDAVKAAAARRLGMKVIPWTVNERGDIARMLQLGVDGLISDYPDRVRDAL
jgi:glycerophosphoryl diester phosphodiesterase